jgi:hypothetical protein
MAVYSSPSIPLDGLIFSIDAGNIKSYSGSGTNVNDIVTGTVETLTNGTGYSSNLSGYFSFDGVDDFINVGSLGTFPTQGTISFWMNSLDISVSIRNPFSTNYNGFNTNVLRFETGETAGSLKAWIGSGSLRGLVFSNITTNAWYNIVVTWNQSTNSFIGYINGVFNCSDATWTVWPTSFVNVGIGTGYNRYFSGFIPQVLIYNRALSSSEIAQLYNSTKDRYSYKEDIVKNGLLLNYDLSSKLTYTSPNTYITSIVNNYTGLVLNGPTYSSNNGGYMNFDGANDHIRVFNSPFGFTTESFTYSYWIYINSFTTNQPSQGPIPYYKGDYNSSGYYSQIGADGIYTFGTNQSGTSQFSSTAPATLTTGAWYYISDVRNGSSVRIYVNGIDRTNVAANHINPIYSSSDLYIASYRLFIFSNIRIGHFKVYNRALSSTEILSNFNALRGRYGI